MKALKTLLLTIVLLNMVSCIDAAPRDSGPKISYSQSVINDWIGKPVTRIMAKWGAPDRVFTTGGKEYHVHESTYTVRGTISRYSNYGTSSYQYVGCTWTFEIKNGIIVGGSAVGQECDGGG